MANDLTFHQLATLLNAIQAQATGVQALTATDTSSFITAGQETLKAGYDVLGTAISQVLSKTIFSVRPYRAKLAGLQMTEQRFGNVTRKLSAIDKPFKNDPSIDPTAMVDGQSIDPFILDKPMVQQENFFGTEVFTRQLTVYDWQLDSAMKGPDQFASFVSMMMTNASDLMEQAREDVRRMTLVNLLAAIIGNYSAQNIKLVTEWNAYLGLTGQNVKTWAGIKGNNSDYQQFMRFAYARIATIAAMLTERSKQFHANIGTKYIMRHTPYDRQRLYMLGQERYEMEAQVLADAFHDNYLKYADVETVNFWQSIQSPDAVNVTPSYLVTSGANAGSVVQGSAVNKTGIFAVLMDEDAAGVVQRNERSSTVYNGRGFYTNFFWAFAEQYYNSFTENAVVFTLD